MATLKQTTCIMDCPDTCALQVTVEDGTVTALTGTKEHPVTDGFICSKVGRFARRMYSQDRVKTPLKRTGPKGSGAFEPISWDEAVTEIAQRFTEIKTRYGGEAVLPYQYGGSNGFMSKEFTDALFFNRLGASRLDATICAAPTGAVYQGMYGRMPGVAYEDYVHARFILIWGCNPKATSIHLVPQLKKARRAGAKIVVVDPINHFSDKEIDLHIGLRPGTDLPLALAIINYWQSHGLLDKAFIDGHCRDAESLLKAAAPWSIDAAAALCRVEAADIEQLARMYAEASPALLRCGWGQERNTNGGQATAAIMAMPALLGKFGVRGGGFTMSNSKAFSLDAQALLGLQPADTRLINMTRLADALDEVSDPPIKALFVYNSNPVATTPGQTRLVRRLADEDLFCVVSEQVMTDTAVFADIVLPAVTFPETHDIRKGYGAYVVGGIRRVVPPVGESLSNHETFCRLAAAMGYDDPPFQWSLDEAFEQVAAAVRCPGGGAVDADVLRAGRTLRGYTENPVQFQTVTPATDSGKIELRPSQLGDAPYAYHSLEQDGFPLALISPASEKMITSTFGEFNFPVLRLLMHPDDAADRTIDTGMPVRVFNDLGEVVVPVKLDVRIARGTVCLPKGAWRKASQNGFTSTALCPTHVNVVAGGACFNDARVEVVAYADS